MGVQYERINVKDLVVETPDSLGFTDVHKLNEELETLRDKDVGEFLTACSMVSCIKLAFPEKFESVKLPSVPWPSVSEELKRELGDNFDIFSVDDIPKDLIALKILYGSETDNLDDSLVGDIRQEVERLKNASDLRRHMIWSVAGKIVWPDKFKTEEIDPQELLDTWVDVGKSRMDQTGDILVLLLYIKGVLGESMNLGLSEEAIEKWSAERRERDKSKKIIDSGFYPFAAVVALDKADFITIDSQGIRIASFNVNEKMSTLPEQRKF